MIVHYKIDEESGKPVPFHVVTVFDDAYRASVETDEKASWIELDEWAPLHEIELSRTNDGAVVAHHAGEGLRALKITPRLLNFAVSCPTGLRVGVESAFSGVPQGTSISVNGSQSAEMDNSGLYEVTPTVAGYYQFEFQKSGYRTLRLRLEAAD